MATEFGTGKTIFILAIVVGCFAILWPKIFYPMIQSSVSPKPNTIPTAENLRQERPPHLRPHMLHPALREKGRAIPHSHIVPRVVEKEPPAMPMPMPGMRPPMGGPGHVVPAPKTGGGTMGIIMPLYTIGIVIFFMYTMMKLIFKKSDESSAYKDFEPDPEFRKVVFSDTPPSAAYQASSIHSHADDNNTRLGWKERDARDIELDQLRRRLEETEAAMERIVAQMVKVPHKPNQSQRAEEELVVKEEVDEVKEEKPQAKPEKTLKGDNGGPEITFLSDEDEEEEEEEDEGIEQVSEDEAEAADNVGFNGEEDLTTNYTTASAAAGLGDETAADISTMEPHHDEDQEYEEELEEDEEDEEEEEEEVISKPQVSTVATTAKNARQVGAKKEEVQEEEEEEEEEELEEEEEDVGRPQSLLHQHQR